MPQRYPEWQFLKESMKNIIIVSVQPSLEPVFEEDLKQSSGTDGDDNLPAASSQTQQQQEQPAHPIHFRRYFARSPIEAPAFVRILELR
jgi:hypothetical protein